MDNILSTETQIFYSIQSDNEESTTEAEEYTTRDASGPQLKDGIEEYNKTHATTEEPSFLDNVSAGIQDNSNLIIIALLIIIIILLIAMLTKKKN